MRSCIPDRAWQVSSTRRLQSLPGSDALDRIELRIEALARKLSQLDDGGTNHGHDAVHHRDLAISQFASIEDRLDEISRAVIALSNIRCPAAGQDLSGIDRVEARLKDLARKFDRAALRKDHPQLDRIAHRLDKLSEKLIAVDKLEASVQHMAEGMTRSSQCANSLDKQVKHLSKCVNEIAESQSASAQITSLEAQIDNISRQLIERNDGKAGSSDGLRIAERLDRIETEIKTGRQHAVQSVQHAAEQAVAKAAQHRPSSEPFKSLSEKVEVLHDLAERESATTGKLAKTIEASFERVAGQIDALESAVSLAVSDSRAQTTAAGPADHPDLAAGLETTGRRAVSKVEAVFEKHTDSAKDRDDLQDLRGQDRLRQDAVAAARRALQATARQMSSSAAGAEPRARESDATDLAGAPSDRRSSALRKPLVLGGAALVMALVVLKGISHLEPDRSGTVAELEPPGTGLEAEIDPTTTASIADQPVQTSTHDAQQSAPTTVPDAIVEPRMTTRQAGEFAHSPSGQVAGPMDGPSGANSTNGISLALAVAGLPQEQFAAGLLDAAESGDPKAYFQIGMQYSSEDHGGSNHREAVQWLIRSARAGFAPAQFAIGSLYEKGQGCRSGPGRGFPLVFESRRTGQCQGHAQSGGQLRNRALAIWQCRFLPGKQVVPQGRRTGNPGQPV